MHPEFTVSKDDIAQLSDGDSRELIARLCKADLAKHGLSSSAVTWGGDQRASDGGIDVNVDSNESFPSSMTLPKQLTGFQVKAEKFGLKKIRDEMAPLGKSKMTKTDASTERRMPDEQGDVRQSIRELAERSGAYIIASTRDHCSDSMLKTRLRAMKDTLASEGLDVNLHVDFFDCQRIADWVGLHLSVLTWVKNKLGKSLHGWQPYAAWAHGETDVNSEFLVDKSPRIVSPNSESQTVITALDCLRRELRNPQSCVRLIGHSGVGKTRLIQALFDDRIETECPALSQSLVAYTDLSGDSAPRPTPQELLECILQTSERTIVIVDNCGADAHQNLQSIATHPKSNTSLLTIEYDIRDDIPEKTSVFRLEPSSPQVLGELVHRKFPFLSNLDVAKIVEFSNGNSRVAFALVNTAEVKGELATLQDDALFRRLFTQRKSEDLDLQRSAEICSLLYSYDVECDDERSELKILGAVGNCDATTLYRHSAELFARGLVQKRGRWRAVLPHAIANRLAEKALATIPRKTLVDHLILGSERIASSFAKRLSYLHSSPDTRDLAARLYAHNGELGSIGQLTRHGRDLFVKVAPANPSAAMAAIQRHFDKTDDGHAKNLDGEFAHTLVSLCYASEHFDAAINILFHIEARDWRTSANPRRASLIRPLFQCKFSGTTASASKRRSCLVRALHSHNGDIREIGRLCLASALKTRDFHNSNGFRFGAHQRDYGWKPESKQEIADWFKTFVSLSIEFGARSDMEGHSFRKILAEAFRGLWREGSTRPDLKVAIQTFGKIDGWPEGWIQLKAMVHHGTQLKSSELIELRDLESLFPIDDLLFQVRSYVLSDFRWAILSLFDRDHGAYVMHVQKLGKDAANDDGLLVTALPGLLTGNTPVIGIFGYALAETRTEVASLVELIRKAIVNLKDEAIDFQFICKVIQAWAERSVESVSSFLDSAVADPVFGRIFPALQMCVPLDDAAFARLKSSLHAGIAEASAYACMHFHQTSCKFSAQDIEELLELVQDKPQGSEAATRCLETTVLYSDDRSEAFRKRLATVVVKHLMLPDEVGPEGRQNHLSSNELLEFALPLASQEEASALLNKIVVQSESSLSYNSGKEVLESFYENFPLMTLSALLAKTSKMPKNVAVQLSKGSESGFSDSPIAKASIEAIVQWCNESPDDRFSSVLQCYPIVQDTFRAPELTPQIKQLFKHCNDREKVIEIIRERLRPNSWSGSHAQAWRDNLILLSEFKQLGADALNQKIDNALRAFESKYLEMREDERQSDLRNNERFE